MYVSICVRVEMPAKPCLIKKKKNLKMDTMNDEQTKCIFEAISEGSKPQFRDRQGLDKVEKNDFFKKLRI